MEKRKVSENDIISASEIGQYYFCSNAWFLQRCGYKPISKQLEIGANKHKELGKMIQDTEKQIKASNVFAIVGILFLIVSLFFLFLEVIL